MKKVKFNFFLNFRMKIHFLNLIFKTKQHPFVNEVQKLNYHKLSLKDLTENFKTCSLNGLDSEFAASLLIKNGKNKLKIKRKNPFLNILSYFFTGFCGLLWVAAIICILAWKPIGNPPDPTNLALGVMLIVVILFQAAFTAFQDYSSNKVMKSIKNMMPSSAIVIRNGIERKINTEDLVVGDLVVLSYGTKVPADIRIIESEDLQFDKSMLTGESEAVDGTVECTDERYIESKNIAYMTTLITNGLGRGIVVEVGDKTMMGNISDLTTNTVEKETNLQKELKRFILFIVIAAIIMALVVIVVWATWLRVKYPSYIDVPTLLVNTISVIVAFIPEGLPVCVTLSLLMIAKRMAKSRVLVKNLNTIETLACVNVIASDKTGTLTQNKMFVSNASVGLELINLSKIINTDKEYSGFTQLVACSALCNNATFVDDEDQNTPINNRKTNGDATDVALLKFSTAYEKFSNLAKKYEVLSEIPFNSRNKWMMKIVRPNDPCVHKSIFGNDVDPEDDVIMIKGAPDYLLKKCTTILDSSGIESSLTNQHILDIVTLQNSFCIMGQRVLILCRRYFKFDDLNSLFTKNDLESFVQKTNDFCMVGLVGIIDPPREGIVDVVETCRKAGIRVLMVTGDYALTAAAIATNIGIFTGSGFDTAEQMKTKHKINHESYERSSLLLTGADLEQFTNDEWRLVTPYEQIVFARTSPEQKLRIVQELQHDGYVVGVTGDGVNDAPALKSADIGIAMGGGSEVAMEAAQLVLLDNNFSSILIAIENGRLVFANLRKVFL